MIWGEYPCCKGELSIYGTNDLEYSKRFAKEECPHCKATVWHFFNGFSSHSYTEEQFKKLYTVDEETKQLSFADGYNGENEGLR